MYMSFFVIMIGPDEKLTIKKRPKCHHNLKICIWHLAKFPQIINKMYVVYKSKLPHIFMKFILKASSLTLKFC